MAAPMTALRRLSSPSVAAGLGKLLSLCSDGKHSPLAGLLLRWPLFSEGNAVGHTGAPQQGGPQWTARVAQGSSSAAIEWPLHWQGPPSAPMDTPVTWPAHQDRDGGTSACAALGGSKSAWKSQTTPAPSPFLMLATGRHCRTTVEHDCAVERPSDGMAAQVQSLGTQLPDLHFQIKPGRSPFRTFTVLPSVSSLVHVRHLSQDVRAKPRVAQARTLRLAAQSVNTVVEPYKRPRVLPLWRRWLTLEGWRVRKDNVMSYVKTGYTIAKVKRAIPGYNVPLFFRDVTRLYLGINRALAAGDVGVLRGLVTERTLGQMKQELEVRRRGGWATVAWDLPNPAAIQCRTVHGRMVGVDPKNTSLAFAQVTVRVQSRQKFAAYDRKGHLLAGSPDQELVVEDHWVFERALWIKDAQWRLCGRLTP